MEILKLFTFSLLLNWCISIQILNQTLPKGRQKYAAILLSVIFGLCSGLVILWI